MKRIIVFCIALLLLMGCGGKADAAPQVQLDDRAQATAAPAADGPEETATPAEPTAAPAEAAPESADAPAAPVPAQEGPVDALVARWNGEALLEGMYPMAAEDALDLYGIDFAACLGGAAFGDADGYTNEAVVIQAEETVLDEAEALLQDHLETVKAQFRGYDPEALALAEKAVLVREGDMLLFVISPNADAMLAAFRSLTA